METAFKQTKYIYNPDDFLSRAIEKSFHGRCEVIQMPIKVYKSENEKLICRFKFHPTFREKLEPCKKHGDTTICTPFYNHVCLECQPHLKERCMCNARIYDCSC